MKHHLTIDDETMEVLRASAITENSVKLPPGQLARPLYEKVNKVLALAGGKWNKGAKAHLFASDPREALGMAIEVGKIKDVKKATQAFYTPPEIARKIVRHASVSGKMVLEPSAGHGAIADAAREAGAIVMCVESDPNSCETLRKKSHHVTEGDFLKRSGSGGTGFERIVMNPPFTADQDVKHVTHAFRNHLRAGGRLVAIMSNSWRGKQNKSCVEFRELVEISGRIAEELPAGAFKESGTEIATVVVILDR